MQPLRLFGTSFMFAAFLASAAQADPNLWVHDDARHLGKVDVVTGAYTNVGTTSATFSDIAFAPDGTLYGITFPGTAFLHVIDTTTAASVSKGSTAKTGLNALVFGRDGTLYAAGGNSLYTIDPATGAATLRGSFAPYQSAGDLAFDAAGNLYLSTTTGSGSFANLVRLDVANGAPTLVGATGYRDVFGLAFGPDGVMYGLSDFDGVVFSIDLATGSGTFRAKLGFPLTGAYGSSFFEEAQPTTTTTTTTTTLPGLVGMENCTNCIDDDGDGMVDFEDPRCCGTTYGLKLRRGSLQAAKKGNRLKLSTQLTGDGLEAVDPTKQDLHVQIRAQAGEILCARVPASAFKKKRKLFKFADRKRKVGGTKGIDGSVVRLLKGQRLQLLIQGKKVELSKPVPGAGSTQVTAAFVGGDGNRCATVTQPFRTVGKKATLRYP